MFRSLYEHLNFYDKHYFRKSYFKFLDNEFDTLDTHVNF